MFLFSFLTAPFIDLKHIATLDSVDFAVVSCRMYGVSRGWQQQAWGSLWLGGWSYLMQMLVLMQLQKWEVASPRGPCLILAAPCNSLVTLRWFSWNRLGGTWCPSHPRQTPHTTLQPRLNWFAIFTWFWSASFPTWLVLVIKLCATTFWNRWRKMGGYACNKLDCLTCSEVWG